MTDRDGKAFRDLYRAARRLMPADGFLDGGDLSDREVVNLTTSVDALRQFAAAVSAAGKEIEPHLAPRGEAFAFVDSFPMSG